MATLSQSLRHDPLVATAHDFIEALFGSCPMRDFQVRFWDGSTWGAGENPRFTLVLKHAGALRQMFSDPSELTLGEAYIYDDYEIEGDILAAMELADVLVHQELALTAKLKLGALLRKFPDRQHTKHGRAPARFSGQLHSLERDRKAISYHYDLPPEFYAMFLDRNMVYSCAYFHSVEDDLETAQLNKFDHLCRKLRLRAGERLLDIGCGWGGLIVHAAKHYGAKALGITLSEPQAQVGQQRIEEEGLQDRCQVAVCDYRELKPDGLFDKIVSVGMFEHVGESMLPEYFARTWKLLKTGGTFLNHGIADSATFKRKGASFTDNYVFPDGGLVPISTTLTVAEKAGFEVRDVESLREHYAMTLREWVHRLEKHAEEARRITNDVVYRVWRLYMAGAAYRFRRGYLNLYQTLLVKPVNGCSGLPLTRADWYS